MTDINRFVTLHIRGIYRNKFVNKDIKNLLIASNLVNSKILNLSKSKKSNFAKVIDSKIDFLTFETKKTFIKTLIFHYFKSEYYIWIEIGALGFGIF